MSEKKFDSMPDFYKPSANSKRGRARNESLVRDKTSQNGLPEDWTRATFIVRVELLNKLKDYAYTKRITLKEALDIALKNLLDDENNLLDHRKHE